MNIKRFRPNKWKDCDGDWFTTGVEEHPDGKYVLCSEYKILEVCCDRKQEEIEKINTIYGSLLEAVKMERLYLSNLHYALDNEDAGLIAEWESKHAAARSEVDKLLQ